MLYKIINIIFQLGLTIIFIMLLLSSIKVIYLNTKYFNIIKSGKIIDIKYDKGSEVDNQRGTYNNTILMDGMIKDTVFGGSQDQFFIGDKVKFRYIGERGNIIFEINNKIIGSKYDVWDWLSPFMFLFTSFMLYMYAKLWFSYLKIK